MNCRKTRIQFGRYLDGELPPPERRALEDHLAGCSRCGNEIAALRRIDAMLAADAAPPPPPELYAAIMRRVRSEPAAQRSWGWLRALAASPWPMRLAATGSATLAAYVGLLIGAAGQARVPTGDADWLASASRSPIVNAYEGSR